MEHEENNKTFLPAEIKHKQDDTTKIEESINVKKGTTSSEKER